MSEADRQKWDARYASGAHSDVAQPCGVLKQNIHLAPLGRSLDVACGAGRNALFMARQGYTVDAVDISSVGLAVGERLAQQQALDINWHCVDLLADPELPHGNYQLILMCHFIAPQLLAQLPARLVPGGVLMAEQHLQLGKSSQQPPAGLSGPSSARFRVAPGSLWRTLQQADPALELLVAEEGLFETAALARVVVRKPGQTNEHTS